MTEFEFIWYLDDEINAYINEGIEPPCEMVSLFNELYDRVYDKQDIDLDEKETE